MTVIECENKFWNGYSWTDQFQQALQFKNSIEAVLLADKLIVEFPVEKLPGKYISVYQDYGDPDNEVLLASVSKD